MLRFVPMTDVMYHTVISQWTAIRNQLHIARTAFCVLQWCTSCALCIHAYAFMERLREKWEFCVKTWEKIPLYVWKLQGKAYVCSVETFLYHLKAGVIQVVCCLHWSNFQKRIALYWSWTIGAYWPKSKIKTDAQKKNVYINNSVCFKCIYLCSHK